MVKRPHPESDDRELVGQMRTWFWLAAKAFPHVRAKDLLGTLLHARIVLFGDFGERSEPLGDVALAQASERCLLAMSRYASLELQLAGLMPLGGPSQMRLFTFAARYLRWVESVLRPALASEDGPARQQSVRAVWGALLELAELEGHLDPRKARNALDKALSSAGLTSEHASGVIDEIESRPADRSTPALAFRDKDGKVRVGHRSLRDASASLRMLTSAQRSERKQEERERRLRQLADLSQVSAADGCGGRPDSPLGRLLAAEAVEVIRRLCEERKGLPIRANATALRAVRASLFELIKGEVQQKAVAERRGVSESSVSRLLDRESRAVIAEARLLLGEETLE